MNLRSNLGLIETAQEDLFYIMGENTAVKSSALLFYTY